MTGYQLTRMPALPTTTSKVTSTLASSLRGGAGRDQRRLIVVGGLPPAQDIQVRIQRKISWLGLDRGETAFWGGFSDVKDGFTPAVTQTLLKYGRRARQAPWVLGPICFCRLSRFQVSLLILKLLALMSIAGS